MLHLFTPMTQGGNRLQLQISDEDFYKISNNFRTLGWKGVVTDVPTGNKYMVMGADCTQPNCRCDAVVIGHLLKEAAE